MVGLLYLFSSICIFHHILDYWILDYWVLDLMAIIRLMWIKGRIEYWSEVRSRRNEGGCKDDLAPLVVLELYKLEYSIYFK